MPKRKANAVWNGKLQSGKGTIKISGNESSYSFKSRFEQGDGTNPEELIAAAHAGCFSMAFAHGLEEQGFSPEKVSTTAIVAIEQDDGGFSITTIELVIEAKVPNIEKEEFEKLAEDAKENCPVSKALAGTNITVKAKLV